MNVFYRANTQVPCFERAPSLYPLTVDGLLPRFEEPESNKERARKTPDG